MKRTMTKILIYTPVHGTPESASVSLGYHQATCQLARSVDVELLDGRMFTDCDLVRARSRAVRIFLASSATHLLHWDADVVGNAGDIKTALTNMLDSGHDLIGAPYPRKRVDWREVAHTAVDYCAVSGTRASNVVDLSVALEARAYSYPYKFGDNDGAETPVSVENGCVEVECMGFGFTLTSRHCLQTMWDHYAPTLSFGDVLGGSVDWTVALFQLLLPPQTSVGPYSVGHMLSEDYSFCARWRACRDTGRGRFNRVQMYVGAGSPLHHVGPHVFRGSRDGLVRA